ncbi:hypothetical protein [Streptomyces sp. NPDC001530]|uniref:hypothetical protein n=1 Tax=Streptomyces sp. NPDC001530 TaxID=3364582 RepID=UPI0036A6E114
MIKRVSHTVTDSNPAGFSLALEVACELHAPATRAPEVAVAVQVPAQAHAHAHAPASAPVPVPVPQMMGLRMSAGHPHRRRVPLNRLSLLAR